MQEILIDLPPRERSALHMAQEKRAQTDPARHPRDHRLRSPSVSPRCPERRGFRKRLDSILD
ncbi:hypothetical protein XM53_16245 [Roseovarius atlanticus]|uniref:Uncharacterized protein n=1 Tax=Roseovarius atlanticus TaxID=1641875 RepID=A0A0T5NRC4_9RHOB|nr:hypothetical protein XM53_16245 [Roseovarius atlanticus]